MHVQSSVKKRCPKCQIIRRGLVLYVMCKDKRRHNQRQGTKIRKKAG